MEIGVVIPVRYDSSRFPGKPLAQISGKTMIERVHHTAMEVVGNENVLVATDDSRIADEVARFGGQAVMTPSDCKNGTERVLAAVNEASLSFDTVINFQGDAPLTPPWILEELITFLEQNPEVEIATPAVKVKWEEAEGTFVTVSLSGRALYFSKSPIPSDKRSKDSPPTLLKHIGMYGYRRNTLERFVNLSPTPLEKIEQLEQLRALQNDIDISVVEVSLRERKVHSVDAPGDIEKVEALIAQQGELFS